MRKLGIKNILSVFGDFRPVERRINNQKVSGWDLSEKSGESVEFENTYNDHVGGSISGKSILRADWQGTSGLSSQVQTVQGQNLCPSPQYGKWDLQNGAYISDNWVVLPNADSKATVKINWTRDITPFYFVITAQSDEYAAGDAGVHIIADYMLFDGTLLSGNGFAKILTSSDLRTSGIFGASEPYSTALRSCDYVRFVVTRSTNYALRPYKFKDVYAGSSRLSPENPHIPFIPNSPSPDYPSPVSPNITAGKYKLPCPWGGYWEITLPIDMHGIGDYKDQLEVDLWTGKGRVKQNIGKKVLDGVNSTKKFTGKNPDCDDYKSFYIDSTTLNRKVELVPTYSTHFQSASWDNIIHSNGDYWWYYGASTGIRLHKSFLLGYDSLTTDADRIAAANTWLSSKNTAGAPVIIYYVLANPLITNLTLTHVDSSTAPSLPLSSLNLTSQTADYPSTIVSAGGEITSRGRNLFDYNTMMFSNATKLGNNVISFRDKIYDRILGKNAWVPKPSTVYTLVFDIIENTFDSEVRIYTDGRFYFGGTSTATLGVISVSFAGQKRICVTSKADYSTVTLGSIWLQSSNTVSGTLKIRLMIIEGDYSAVPLSYYPYRQPSSILLPTSGSAGDEEDTLEYVGEGVWRFTQSTAEKVFNGTEPLYHERTTDTYLECYYVITGKQFGERNITCTHFPIGISITSPINSAIGRINNSAVSMVVSKSIADTVETLKAVFAAQYSAGTPLKIRYQRATPIVTYLNLGELKSFPRYTHIEQLGDVKAMLNLNAKVYA